MTVMRTLWTAWKFHYHLGGVAVRSLAQQQATGDCHSSDDSASDDSEARCTEEAAEGGKVASSRPVRRNSRVGASESVRRTSVTEKRSVVRPRRESQLVPSELSAALAAELADAQELAAKPDDEKTREGGRRRPSKIGEGVFAGLRRMSQSLARSSASRVVAPSGEVTSSEHETPAKSLRRTSSVAPAGSESKSPRSPRTSRTPRSPRHSVRPRKESSSLADPGWSAALEAEIKYGELQPADDDDDDDDHDHDEAKQQRRRTAEPGTSVELRGRKRTLVGEGFAAGFRKASRKMSKLATSVAKVVTEGSLSPRSPKASLIHKTSRVRIKIFRNGHENDTVLHLLDDSDPWAVTKLKLARRVAEGGVVDEAKAAAIRVFLHPEGDEVTEAAMVEKNDRLAISIDGVPFIRGVPPRASPLGPASGMPRRQGSFRVAKGLPTRGSFRVAPAGLRASGSFRVSPGAGGVGSGRPGLRATGSFRVREPGGGGKLKFQDAARRALAASHREAGADSVMDGFGDGIGATSVPTTPMTRLQSVARLVKSERAERSGDAETRSTITDMLIGEATAVSGLRRASDDHAKPSHRPNLKSVKGMKKFQAVGHFLGKMKTVHRTGSAEKVGSAGSGSDGEEEEVTTYTEEGDGLPHAKPQSVVADSAPKPYSLDDAYGDNVSEDDDDLANVGKVVYKAKDVSPQGATDVKKSNGDSRCAAKAGWASTDDADDSATSDKKVDPAKSARVQRVQSARWFPGRNRRQGVVRQRVSSVFSRGRTKSKSGHRMSDMRGRKSTSRKVAFDPNKRGSVIERIQDMRARKRQLRSEQAEKRKQASEDRARKQVAQQSLDKYIKSVCDVYGYINSRPTERIRERFVWKPEAAVVMTWQVCILALTVFYVFKVPIRVCFDAPVEAWEEAFDMTADIMFLCDIGLNFRIAYEDHLTGLLISDPWRIAIHYLQLWFWIDLVSSVPFSFFDLGESKAASANKLLRQAKLLKMIRLLKLLRMFKLTRYFHKFENNLKFNPGINRLLKSFVFLFLVWHYIGCFYWLIVDYEYEGTELCNDPDRLARFNATPGFRSYEIPGQQVCFVKDCLYFGSCAGSPVNYTRLKLENRTLRHNELHPDEWVPHPEYANVAVWEQYLASIYWAIEVTTGIGDDVPIYSATEVAYTILVVVIGLLMYSVIIGSASAALQNLDSSSVKRREKVDNIHSYLRTRRVPRFFTKVITDYYEHMWSVGAGHQDEQGLLSELPQTLRVRLTLILNRDLAQRIPILANFSASMFIRLVQRLGNETFLPGEFVVKTGEPADAIYFIKTGKIDIIAPDQATLVATLYPGGFFGERAIIITDALRNCFCRAADYCELLVLTATAFAELEEQDVKNEDVLSFRKEIGQTSDMRAQELHGILERDENVRPGDLQGLVDPRDPDAYDDMFIEELQDQEIQPVEDDLSGSDSEDGQGSGAQVGTELGLNVNRTDFRRMSMSAQSMSTTWSMGSSVPAGSQSSMQGTELTSLKEEAEA